ncbi:MAG: type II secretion system F family protein [Thaumarchaeota archaeon]|nr:type II secretion system F family protein [Nitrososphaerota archaeon]
MTIKIRNPFKRKKNRDAEDELKNEEPSSMIQKKEKRSFLSRKKEDSEADIERDITTNNQVQVSAEKEPDGKDGEKRKNRFSFGQKKPKEVSEGASHEIPVRSRNSLERVAYNLLAKRLPGFPEFKEAYGQSGIPLIFEAYISTGFLLSILVTIPTFAISLIVETRLYPRGSILFSLVGSFVLSGVAFGLALVIWLFYPMLRRRSSKSKLEGQLAYSFGILGVLAAAGINLERLFERIATSESNPVLADLAKRFLRNIRVFGLDTETALAEVAEHCPSEAFSKMLDSIAVAYKTTGSIHDLVFFESARLLQEKRDKLRKTIGTLAVMAELYITLVVVGPIIFIVMMAIFGLLPGGNLPNPISVINLIVFIGIPVLSVMFVLLLDSVVSKA